MKLICVLLTLVSMPAFALTLTTEELPPFNFVKDGNVVGQSTDVMREVLKRTGIPGGISVYPWKQAYQMAQEGKDTCVYSTSRTEARESLFKWVGPLATNTWTLYAKASNPLPIIRSLDDAKKYSVGTYQSDAKAVFLKENNFKTDDSAMNDEQVIRKLDDGKIDLWLASSGISRRIARSAKIGIKPVFVVREINMFAACNLAVPDQDIARMNDAVKAIKYDGTFDKILNLYY